MAIEGYLRLTALGDVQLIKICVDSLGINAHDAEGVTGLMIASSAGLLEVVRWFLQSGANANLQDGDGRTAFHVAAACGRSDILTELAPHTLPSLQNSKDVDGRSPVHLAVVHNRYSAVRTLAANPLVDLNCCDEFGGAPIHAAAALGHSRILRFLFTHPLVDARATEEDGTNAVHLAAAYGRMATLQFLHLSGAFDLNAKTHAGATALHLACIRGDLDVVRYLYPKTTHGVDCDGDTELHLAVRHVAVTRFLLNQATQDVAAVTNDGSTPLHRAVGLELSHSPSQSPSRVRGHFDVVKALVQAKAPLHAKDNMGSTPVHAACHRGNVDVVKFLLAHKGDIQSTDKDGFTALHAAAQNGHLPLVKFLVKELGCEVDTVSPKGSTPLMCALRFTQCKVVKWLVQHGKADVRKQSEFGTPVDVARRFERLEPQARVLSEWLARPCGREGCLQRGSKKCGGCVSVRYCSVECQREHWSTHEGECVLSL